MMQALLNAVRVNTGVSSAHRFAVVLVLFGCLSLAATSNGPATWSGLLQDTALFVAAMTFIALGPVCVVLGATSARSLRTTYGDLVRRSAVTPQRALIVRVQADLMWVLAALAIVYAAAFVIGFPPRGAGPVWVLLVLGVSSAVLCYMFGFFIGSWAPRLGLLLGASTLPYLLAFVSAYAALRIGVRWTILFAPFIEARWYPDRVPNVPGILLLIAYSASLSALLLSAAAGRFMNRQMQARKQYTRTGSLIASLITGSALVLAWSPNLFSQERTTADLICDQKNQVCLWPEHAAKLGQWSTYAQIALHTIDPITDIDRVRVLDSGVEASVPHDVVLTFSADDVVSQNATTLALSILNRGRGCTSEDRINLREAIEAAISNSTQLQSEDVATVSADCL